MENNKQSQDNIISELWVKYFPYWPIFLLMVLLAIGSAWLILRIKHPVYEAQATLMIKDEKKGIGEAKMMEGLDLLSTKKIIENEIEVLKSRKLLSQVVGELRLYAPVYEKSEWTDIPVYASSPIQIEARNPDSIISAERIAIKIDLKKNKVIIQDKEYSINEWVNTDWGTLKFSTHYHNYDTSKVYYFSLVHPKKVVQNLFSKLSIVTASKLSSVIYLKLRDQEPSRAEDILNSLLRAYDLAVINDKNALAANTLSFLDDRLQFVSQGLDSIEKSLQQYRERKGAIDISSQGKLFLQNVSQNDQKLSEVNMKLAILGQIEQYLFSKDGKNGIVPTNLGFDEPVLANLLTKLYDLELQYEKLRKTTGENNPEAVALFDQIQKIKPNILQYVRSQKQSLSLEKSNLYATNVGYNSLLKALPKQEQDIVEISREQNIKSSIYSFLLQRREETALSHSATLSDSRVVDKAEYSPDPVGFGSKVVYFIAIFLACAIAAGLITAREFFTNTILFRHEIEASTNYPVISDIMFVKSKSPIVIQKGKASFISEQFRLLRTSIAYLNSNGKGKKILVTSSIPKEGKSFVAANLALTLAAGGKKVVLLEFDLSSPTLASKLDICASKGISNYLNGEVMIEDVIQRIGEYDNLFLLTAGTLPPDPSELILSDRTGQLLRYLEVQYDYIIVDSAPVGVLSDGYVLAKHCDATLYIVRHGHTPKKMLQRLEENNKINELRNIGIVFNGINSRGYAGKKYGYSHGYSYSYGYGYQNAYLKSHKKQDTIQS
ncbi:MAG: polysaccharide biosynthesis tyrosine autokinase [Flavobacterium sp.]|nr:MAG: polysaccharide biosynthesis tyrosine autokinase [Flavobacterium sp.]